MEKLTAPKLPEGYRFKVETYKRRSRHACNMVTLEKRRWVFGWTTVKYNFCNFNNEADPEAVLDTMNQLIHENLGPTSEGYAGFNGYYPPRETL